MALLFCAQKQISCTLYLGNFWERIHTADKSRGWSWGCLLLEPWSLRKNLVFWSTWVAGVASKAPHSSSALHFLLLLHRNTGSSTVLCCYERSSTKSPPLSDLVVHLIESGATFKLVLWNYMNKLQKVVWVQKGSSIALFIYWHLIYSSLSCSVMLEDKFALPDGKKPNQTKPDIN